MATPTNSKKRKLSPETDDSLPAKKKQKLDKNEDDVHAKDEKQMTRNEFLKYAKDIIGVCGDIKFPVKTKRNSTNSVGWHSSHHDVITLSKDIKVAVVIGLNATVIGSKKWEDGEVVSNEEKHDDNDDIEGDKKKMNVSGDIMSKQSFLSIAKDLKLELFDEEITLKPKKTKQGSVGWSASGLKIKTEVNGVPLRLQTSINFTVKKSKQWNEGEKDEENDK